MKVEVKDALECMQLLEKALLRGTIDWLKKNQAKEFDVPAYKGGFLYDDCLKGPGPPEFVQTAATVVHLMRDLGIEKKP